MDEARAAQAAEIGELRARIAALEQRLDAQARSTREQTAALQRAREEQQALLTREKAVMDTALDCIVAMDHEGRVVDFNPAAEHTFGYSREEAVGQVMADLIIPPALRSAHWDGLARYLATGEAKILNRRLELSAIRRGGAEFPVELTITQVPSDGPPLFFGYLRDITERRTAAIENARLVEEAERARAEAEDANHAKSKFLAGMSHELRTPLNAIDGYAALLEEDIAGPLTEMQRDYIARVRRSQKHLLGLIDDVLNFTRIEAGRVEFEITDVLLAEVVREVIAMIEPQVRSRKINFDRITSFEVVVRADREKLVQVLLNLVSNAVKFTDLHGEISMACAQDNSSVHVSVSDTGIGIPADKLEAVFEPFVQVQRTHVAEGTGLGLTVSRDLARAMEGDLTVRSELGEGSTFTLTLPLARDSVE